MAEPETVTASSGADAPAPGDAPVTTAAVPVVDAEPATDPQADPTPAAATIDEATARRFWGDDEPADVIDQSTRRGRRRARRRARRRVNIIRHISPWSVLKVSIPFFLFSWIVIVVAGVILWSLGEEAGLVTNAENFWAEATGQESVQWDGEILFRSSAMAGGVLALACTGFAVLFTMLFNLICDVTGGIRMTVLELDTPPSRARRRQARAARRAESKDRSGTGGSRRSRRRS